MSGSGVLNSEMATLRAKPVVVRNSRLLLGLTFLGSFAAAFMALCMLVMAATIIFPGGTSPWSFDKVWNAVAWGFGALFTGQGCPYLWKQGMAMVRCRAIMDEHGVDLRMGTKKKPADLFMAWEKVASIRQKRVGNAQEFTVTGSDGSFARFTSYTFFRPKKVARLIAQRTGLAIEKA
jgi:hypothetical protein